MIKEAQVLEALKHVEDPDLKKDLVSLGMIRNLIISEQEIRFSVYLTTPACPMKDLLETACRNAIKHFIGEQVQIHILMTAEVKGQKEISDAMPGVKNIIAIASGKGGVGKSTVTAGIAQVLQASGARVGIMDADIYGPSIPILFGVENHPVEMVEVDGKELMRPVDVEGIKLFSIGFLSKPGEAIVWRGPMVSQAIKQFMNGVNWGELDYLIIDLPPGTGDVQLTIVQNMPLSGAIIVTTPQKLARADASRACAMFRMPSVQVPVLGLVENMAYYEPEDQENKKYYLFGKDGGALLAAELNIHLLGQIPIHSDIIRTADSGKINQSENFKIFTEIAGRMVQELAIVHSREESNHDK